MTRIATAAVQRPVASTSPAAPFVKTGGRSRTVTLGGVKAQMMTLDPNVNREANKVGVWFGGAAYQLDPKALKAAPSRTKLLAEALTGVTGDPSLFNATGARSARITRADVFRELDRVTRLPQLDTPKIVTARQAQLRLLVGRMLDDKKMIAWRVSAPIPVQPYSGVVAVNTATGRIHVLGAWTH